MTFLHVLLAQKIAFWLVSLTPYCSLDCFVSALPRKFQSKCFHQVVWSKLSNGNEAMKFKIILILISSALGLFATLASETQPRYITLHTFSLNNGEYPFGGLTISGDSLFGTTKEGGIGFGTIFRINKDGAGFTNLHKFSMIAYDPSSFYETNSDGVDPQPGLIISGDILFGIASAGGSMGQGTIFRINTDGTCFTNLYNFKQPKGTDYGDGGPTARLLLSSNFLYGTAIGGGSFGKGTIFRINTDGSGFTNLYSFTGFAYGGSDPATGLILSDNTFYGTARGGSAGLGIIYKINLDGSGFSVVHSFTGGNDGGFPYASMVISSNSLFGTTQGGG